MSFPFFVYVKTGGEMSEKRRFIRFNVLLDAISRTAEGALKKFKINNISKDGVGILCDEMLNMGDDIEMEMMIPGDNMPVLFKGEVAWVANSSYNNARYKSGLKFKKIRSEDRNRVLEYIYQKWLMSDDLGNKVMRNGGN